MELLQKQQQQQHQQRHNRDRDRDGNGNVDRQLTGHNGNGGHRSSVGQVSHRQRANVAGVAATLQGSERISNLTGGGGAGGAGGSNGAAGAGGDQHTALMDEFKRAHQRMFRNGFHESEHKVSKQQHPKRSSHIANPLIVGYSQRSSEPAPQTALVVGQWLEDPSNLAGIPPCHLKTAIPSPLLIADITQPSSNSSSWPLVELAFEGGEAPL